MTNQKKSYARAAYLSQKTKGDVRLSQIIVSEKNFFKQHNVSSEELMEKYQLSPESIKKMLEFIEKEEKITFNKEEEQFIADEIGG